MQGWESIITGESMKTLLLPALEHFFCMRSRDGRQLIQALGICT